MDSNNKNIEIDIMKSVFRKPKRLKRLRRIFEELQNDSEFMKRISEIRKLMNNQTNGTQKKVEEMFYNLAKEYGLPMSGPLTQLIEKGTIDDYSFFNACIVEFSYMDYANQVSANQLPHDDYKLKSLQESFPIQIRIASDASSNEIKDCISANLNLITGWQKFMPPKHWKKTRKSPRAKRNAYILELDQNNPKMTDEEIARETRKKYPTEACDPDIVSKTRNRTRKRNKRSQ